jgi:hypothetical protein
VIASAIAFTFEFRWFDAPDIPITGSPGRSRGPDPFPERFSERLPELCNWTPARADRLARG